MRRRVFDIIASSVGLGLAIVLLVAGGLLTWAHNFVSDEVHNQLAAQKVFFPPKGNAALTALPAADRSAMEQYAGQQLTSGNQAETYADHFIKVRLQEIGGGQTYSQLSGKFLAMTPAQQASKAGVALNGQVQTMFRGETLRGLLLNAYAFGKMGTIAGIAAIVAWISGAMMLVLAGLGFWHSRRASEASEMFAGHARSPAVEQIP